MNPSRVPRPNGWMVAILLVIAPACPSQPDELTDPRDRAFLNAYLDLVGQRSGQRTAVVDSAYTDSVTSAILEKHSMTPEEFNRFRAQREGNVEYWKVFYEAAAREMEMRSQPPDSIRQRRVPYD